jgi:hypothetical protein
MPVTRRRRRPQRGGAHHTKEFYATIFIDNEDSPAHNTYVDLVTLDALDAAKLAPLSAKILTYFHNYATVLKNPDTKLFARDILETYIDAEIWNDIKNYVDNIRYNHLGGDRFNVSFDLHDDKEAKRDSIVDVLIKKVEQFYDESIVYGDEDEIWTLLASENEIDYNRRFDGPYHGVLFLAVTNKHHVIVDSLLKSGANPNKQNIHGATPLMVAVEIGDIESIHMLLRAGADVHIKGEHNETALHLAAWKGDINIVRNLLDFVKPYAKDKDGETPISIAKKYGHEAIVKLMEEYQPNIIGHILQVPIYDTRGHEHEIREATKPARIIEAGPCHFEVTDTAVKNFHLKFEELKGIPNYKEILHYVFTSLFPGEAPIATISDDNPLKPLVDILDSLKPLNNPDLGVLEKRFIVQDVIFALEDVNEEDPLLKLLRLRNKIIKQVQTIKVEFLTKKKSPDGEVQFIDSHIYAYYNLYDCSIDSDSVVNIADSYTVITETEYDYNAGDEWETITAVSPLLPFLHVADGKKALISRLPDIYSLPQISAINSWITHGLLSRYLLLPDFIKSVLTNPLVGNDEFWTEISAAMETQLEHLCSASKPLTRDIMVYRGSPHMETKKIVERTIITTSTNKRVANTFNATRRAREIHIPAGTHVLDLEDLNIREKEILILPSCAAGKLAREPIELSENYSQRNKYRVWNPNANVGAVGGAGGGGAVGGAGGGAGAGAGGFGGGGRRRRRTQKQKRRNT